MEPNDAVDRRDELIRQACQAAGQRLAGSTSPDPALIATGELLFWIVAADDSMLRSARPGYAVYRNDEDDHRKLLMQALRYPRNVLAHEAEAWEFGISDAYADTYTELYGAWTWTNLSAPSPGAPDHVAAQHDAYEQRLAGRPVITTAQDALGILEEFWTRH